MEKNADNDLKKQEFEIHGNGDEIKDLNNEGALHLNDGLVNNNNDDIEYIGITK